MISRIRHSNTAVYRCNNNHEPFTCEAHIYGGSIERPVVNLTPNFAMYETVFEKS